MKKNCLGSVTEKLTKQKGQESGGITEVYCYMGMFHKNVVYSYHITRCVFRIIIQVNAQHHYCGDLMTLISLILNLVPQLTINCLNQYQTRHMIYIHTFDIFGSHRICLLV